MSRPDVSFGMPLPLEGPDIAYKNEKPSNPITRGYVLMLAATLIKSSSMLRGVLWKLNGFDKIKNIPELASYEARYDPTVIPSFSNGGETVSVDQLACPAARTTDHRYYTVGDYHNAFKSQTLTPSDVVESLFPLIDPSTKTPSKQTVAFLEVQSGLVRAAAKASTERYKAGKPLSVLDGVPVAVKDEIDLKGYSKCLGSKLDFTNPLDQTGWCIRKWEEAGAVIIGKTNMHEVGMDTTGNNPMKGTPLNPHNNSYYCGGSSSGSAMAVAAGICPIAHGGDGGGSIRLPSGFCGLYGIKPSHGRVSNRPSRSLAPTVGAQGPLASDLESLEIAYRVMAQPDPEHISSRLFPSPLTQNFGTTTSSTKKIIGLYHDWIARSDPVVQTMFENAVQYYAKTPGYQIVDISIPFLTEGQKAHAPTILSEVRSGLTSTQLNQLSYSNQIVLNVTGSHATTQDFMADQKLRNLMMRHLAWLWKQYPGMVIMTPTTPCAGSPIKLPSDVTDGYGIIDGDQTIRVMEYVYLANFMGCPALTRPMGYTDDNVPVGLMAMGEWGSEEQLFTWARDGEGLLEGGVRIPKHDGNWVDVLDRAHAVKSRTE